MTNYVMTEKQYNKLNGYQLHKAKTFWRGNGVAFKYKEKIKLMSEKLTNRQGFIVFDRILSASERWALTIDFSTHNVHKEHGEGMGVW